MNDSKSYEQSVLGAVLLVTDGRAPLKRLLGLGLRSQHFAYSRNRAIFQAMVTLTDRDESLDVLTVLSELQRKGRVTNPATASNYLHSLPNVVPNAGNFMAYGQRVIELAAIRQKRQAALELAEAADREDYSAVLEAEAKLTAIELPGASAVIPRLRPVEGLA